MLTNIFKKTLNQRGYAIERLDEFSQRFVEEAAVAGQEGLPCLEVGAAFGFATIEALKQGAKMIANDVELTHLDSIEKSTPQAYKHNLTLLQGEFPRSFKVEENTVKHVLICRVTHYFTPEEMEEAIAILYKILQPGGKVFLISETPYGAVFKNFLPIYESKKSAGENWPGFIENLPLYMEKFSEDNPNQMLLLGESELEAGFLKAGFTIERCSFFSRKDIFPSELCSDGRESVGIIAAKPRSLL